MIATSQRLLVGCICAGSTSEASLPAEAAKPPSLLKFCGLAAILTPGLATKDADFSGKG